MKKTNISMQINRTYVFLITLLGTGLFFTIGMLLYSNTAESINHSMLLLFFVIIASVMSISGILIIKIILDSKNNKSSKISDKIFLEFQDELKTTLGSIGDAVINTDVNGFITQMNPVAESLTGWTNIDAKGKPLVDVFSIIDEKSQLKIENPAEIAVKTNKRVGFTNHTLLISKDGGKIPIVNGGTLIKNELGKIINVILVFRDRTEVKKKEKIILESVHKYNNLFNSIRDSILIADTDRKIIDCNPAFVDLFGYKLEDIQGKETNYVYENIDEYNRMGSKIKENLDNPNFLHIINYKKKNGEVFPGETNVFYLKDVDGKIIGFIGLIRDISERIKSEEEKHRILETLNTAFDQSPTGIVLADENGKVNYINQSGLQIGGKDLSELAVGIDKYVSNWQLYHLNGDIMQAKEVPLARAVLYGETNSLEFIIKREDTDVTILTNAAPIKDKNNNIIGGVAVFIDISESKEIEKALLESQKRFRRLLQEVSSIAVQGYDENRKVIFWNKASEYLYGYSSEEAIGKDLLDLIIPDEMRELVEDAIQKMIITGKGFPAEELVLKRKDGSLVPVLSNHTVIDTSNNKKELYCLDIDLTDRKNAERDLKESEERYRLIHENSMDAILLTEPDGSIISANHSACRMFQMTQEEICKLGRSGVVDTTDTRLPELLEERKQNGFVKGVLTFFRKDKSKFQAEFTSSIFVNSEGKLRTSMIIRDITERKKYEDELKNQAEELMKANTELQQFNKLSVGREFRMIELKEQINALSQKLGVDPPYDLSIFNNNSINGK